MKKLKLLFIVNVDWFFISHRLPIALAAIENGYEVHIATTITNFEKKLKGKGLKVHHITFQRSGSNPFLLLNSFLAILILYYRIKPNLVHLVTIQPVILGSIAAKFNSSISVIAAVSGLGYVFSSKGIYATIRRQIVLSLYRLALKRKKLSVIFQNKIDQQTIINNTSLNHKKAVLIKGSGVDLSKYKKTSIKKDKHVVLFAGRLLKSKGLREFLYAAECLNYKAKFLVAGKLDFENKDCINEDEFYKSINKNHIEYVGYSEEMASIISSASVVCLPSYYGEGLPLILAEAAASAKPIITTNHPGCRDAIIDGITGVLIPKRDKEALTIALNKLLNNQSLMEKMGEKGRIFAEENFDINLVVHQHLKIYSNLSE